MTGETPDDIEARRVANEKVLRDAISSAFTKPIPSVVPRDPTPRMSESNSGYANGQYRELKADVDNLKVNFADLRHDIDARFKEQSADSREMHREMLERLDKQSDQQNSGKPSIEKVATVGFGAISLVLTLVWGYSTLTQGAINDKISFTNSKIDTDVSRTEKTVDKLAEIVTKRADHVDERFQKFVDDTVPRRELDNRFNRDEGNEAGLARTINENLVPRTEFEKRIETIREDIGTLKDDTLKRADIDGRFNDFTKRLDLISNRVEVLQANTAGTAVLQEQLKEAQNQITELRSRWLTPGSR